MREGLPGIQKLEAEVASIQAQTHALATKLQAQERQKRTALEQALEQTLERTHQHQQELTRLNQVSEKGNTASPPQNEIKDMWLVCAKCRRTCILQERGHRQGDT